MAYSRPRAVTYRNYNYDPYATKVDISYPCTVCGFIIDPEITQEPEQAVFHFTITGTSYSVPAGTPVEGLGAADLDVLTTYGAHTGCPFCGSPNWAWAREPGLRW